jgi:hypothetical protein
MIIKNLLITMLIIFGTLNATECSYKKLFGFAKIKRIKDNLADLSFTIEESFGRSRLYEESLSIVVPDGVKPKSTYPAVLYIRATGECQKYKLMIIQEIGSSCKVK